MIAGEGDCNFHDCRGCLYGVVDSVQSISKTPPLNPDEPEDLATAIESMGINHAVIITIETTYPMEEQSLQKMYNGSSR